VLRCALGAVAFVLGVLGKPSRSMQKPVGFIYKVTNRINGKAYVGLTTNQVSDRWQLHIRLAERSEKPTGLRAAIKKYGADKFEIVQIDVAHSIKELIDKEVSAIQLHGTRAPKGYNLTKGGELPSGTPITINDIEYRNIKVAAEVFEVPYKLVYSRLVKVGWSVREAFGLEPSPVLHKHPVEIRGEIFESQSNAARAYGLSNRLVWARLKNGWSIEEALGLEPPPNSFEINGKLYPSRNDAARAYGVNPNVVNGRLQKGWTVRQALDVDPPPRSFTVSGKLYKTLKAACRDFCISAELARSRVKRGWTYEQALEIAPPPIDRSIKVGGIVYPTLSEACHVHDLDAKTVRYRLSAGWSIEQAFEQSDPPARISKGREIVVEGVAFPSLTQAAKLYGVNAGTAQSRIKMGWTIDQVFSLEERPKRTAHNAEPIELNEIVYASRSQAAEAHGIPVKIVESRLKLGWSVREAFGLTGRANYRGPREVHISGHDFRSISQAAKQFGLKSHTLRARIASGWDIQNALFTGRKKTTRRITINGVTYESLRSAASAHGLREKLVSNRLGKGWSLVRALTTPASPSSRPVSIDGRTFATFKQAAIFYGLEPATVRQRLKLGWNIEEAFNVKEREGKSYKGRPTTDSSCPPPQGGAFHPRRRGS